MKAGDIFDENAVIKDTSYLNKIMTINEDIDECETAVELKAKKDVIIAEVEQLVKSINKLFENKQYQDIVDELIKTRFCKRAIEHVERNETNMM